MTSSAWLNRHEKKLVILLLLLAFVVRLYRVTNPLLDWHAWRQADTASVTREYLKKGLNPLEPTYLDLSNIPSGKDNPVGYRMVEFPLINLTTAAILRTLPIAPLEQTSRLLSIIFSVVGLAALYGIVCSISGKTIALASGIAYAFLPYSIYYGRVVLPEPILVGTILVSIYAFQRWLFSGSKSWYLLSFVSLLISYLIKPYAVFFIPIFIALSYLRYSWRMVLQPWLWFFAVATPLPMLWWRSWITHYPEGIPASSWLFNGNDIRFKPAWVRWLFYERLSRLISGTLGVILIGANSLKFTVSEMLVYGAWWLGMLLYFSVFATGNVQHDYYQVLVIPIVAISIGRGGVSLLTFLSEKKHALKQLIPFALWILVVIAYSSTLAFGWQLSGLAPDRIWLEFVTMNIASLGTLSLLILHIRRQTLPKLLSIFTVGGLFLGALLLSWQYVGGYFNVNHWQYVRAGQAVQAVAAPDALIIAPAMGDTQLLFQTDRRGWPIGGEIEKKISQGADYYLSTNQDDETNALLQRYMIVTQTDEYTLIDLHQASSATSAAERDQ